MLVGSYYAKVKVEEDYFFIFLYFMKNGKVRISGIGFGGLVFLPITLLLSNYLN